MTLDWELVSDNSAGDRAEQARVPGGFLYRCTAVRYDYLGIRQGVSVSVAVTFVPDPERA